ncbi:hypothetical protein BDV3_006815 [Batrachochytrium dendrobatidis]|nr:hypothetical protein O5D80_008425 [Batrachochytrium dendrobatidis]KAK5665779.1 hypothetical protein QVD99_007413 [Batrachochytrium dendrobatidis]
MPSPFTYVKTGYSVDMIPDLTGKVAIVTGGNTGIGYETVHALAKAGAKVFMASRSEERAVEAIAKIHKDLGKNDMVEFLRLDLQDLKQTKTAALNFLAMSLPLDILVNNAGIMACPFALTKDGIESQMGTNHLGHFLFTTTLIPALEKAAPSRVVCVSSFGHSITTEVGINFERINDESLCSSWQRYGQSKLANILFARSLAKRLASSKVYVNSLHPGVVHTEIMRGPANLYGLTGIFSGLSWLATGLTGMIALTPKQGALTQLYLATSPDISDQGISGKYFIPFGKESDDCTPFAKDDDLAEKLWEWSQNIVDKIH